MFIGKGTLKICSKFTGEHPYETMISIKLLPKCDFNSNFTEITLWYWYSPINLLDIFRTPFPKNTSGRLLQTNETLATNKIHTSSRISVAAINDWFSCESETCCCEFWYILPQPALTCSRSTLTSFWFIYWYL